MKQPPLVEFEGESLPNDVEVMIVGFCLALSQALVQLSKQNPVEAIQYSPFVCSLIAEYMVNNSQRII